jgi:uncharacterized protein with LGFP repeats
MLSLDLQSQVAHPTWRAINAVYGSLGGPGGPLGFPVTGEQPAPPSPTGVTGVVQRFEHRWSYPAEITTRSGGPRYGAAIYWCERYGAHVTWGGIGESYEALGGPGRALGFPVTGEIEASSPAGTTGYHQQFENGLILWSEAHGARSARKIM